MNGDLTCFGVPVGNQTAGLLWMVRYIIEGLGKYVSVGVFPEFPFLPRSCLVLLCVQQIVRLKTPGPPIPVCITVAAAPTVGGCVCDLR